MPRSVLFVELKACQMANDAGHCHRAWTPWWAEVEVKIVIFHEPVAMDAVLYKTLTPCAKRIVFGVLTVLNCPPLRC